jgi:hypothetical protein
MAGANDGKVTVEVKVVVEGGTGAVKVAPARALPLLLPNHQVLNPAPATAGTPVTQSGEVNYINANGTADSPLVVWAKVYSGTQTASTVSATPDCGALCLSNPGTTWSFLVSTLNGLLTPTCDPSSQCGPANNTLVVWYDFSNVEGIPFPYEMDIVPIHAYCPGASGCGSGSGSGCSGMLGKRDVQATLVAAFSGALASLGSVTLKWTGAGWLGKGPGGIVLAFLGSETEVNLIAGGEHAAFSVSGRPTSFHPFHWSADGQAHGRLHGHFSVHVME